MARAKRDLDEANAMLSRHLASGMTLVVSYWAGATADEMSWLDGPCTSNEQRDWHCTDIYVDTHRKQGTNSLVQPHAVLETLA